MGQAQSSNFTNTVIGTYMKVVQETTSTALVSSLNQARISVSGGKGDVNISNVLSKQTIKNDMTASFKSVNESTVLQKVSQEISQQASSMISGLNLGNFSESKNSLNTSINASMDISQTISTSCSAMAANKFDIEVSKQEGDVNINDVKIDQAIENTMSCATESLNKSIASQEIENKIAQKAVSETKGLTLDFIAAIIIAIIAGVVAVPIVGAKFLIIIVPIVVIIIEYLFYTRQLIPINQNIEKIMDIIEKNNKILKQPKPLQKIKTFYYTCGLYGIDNYTGCFSSTSNTTTSSPKQNVAGCTFKEVPVTVTFSDPDQAYSYWIDQPTLNGIDIISKNNGESYEYHFYSNISKECIKLMDGLTKNKNYVKIPPLFCVMKDPVVNSSYLPTLSADSGPTFVFTFDGFLYYTENNVWNKVNTTSLFNASSKDNILIVITPLEDTTIRIPSTVTGDYFFIDMSKARKGENDEDLDKYYYKIYKYKIGNETRAPDIKLEPPRTDFKEISTLDVTDLVKTKQIGPFMPNPKLKSSMNYTAIYDPDIEIQTFQVENQKELTKQKNEQKKWQIIMSVVGILGGFLTIIVGISTMTGKKKQQQSTANKNK